MSLEQLHLLEQPGIMRREMMEEFELAPVFVRA
jgi:hypothetical protein